MALSKSIRIHDARKFTVHNGNLIAEASDLGCLAGTPPHSRLYDDAIDVGFQLDTGFAGSPLVKGTRPAIFALTKTEEHDGEVYSWSYQQVGGPWTVRIFND